MERFLEQYPAIQAAAMDPRLKRGMDRERVQRVSHDDIRKCEDFIDTRVLYQCTLCVSSDKSATAGQILPILNKLQIKERISPHAIHIKATMTLCGSWRRLQSWILGSRRCVVPLENRSHGKLLASHACQQK
ncbi:uncharacterized protein LOC117527620 isoform X5, partial [Scomber scombrus]